MSDRLVHTTAAMGTVVTIEVIGQRDDATQRDERSLAVSRAATWFTEIEDRCTRFDPASELSQLTHHVGVPIEVSPLLFEALQFALAVARDSGGAFDPTVGHRMERRGFDREFRSGHVVRTGITDDEGVSYRDLVVDATTRTVTLLKPLLLDLGAVAKGLAIDLAARELRSLRNFAIDAGGDLYLGGQNADGAEWSVGIRNPRDVTEVIARVSVSDGAVCTSGDYERKRVDGHEHHLLDPRTGDSANALASVTVLAPTAMVADALATAAFVLGPDAGLAFLERQGVEGLLITPALERIATPRMRLD